MVQSKAQLDNLKNGVKFTDETATRNGRKGAKKANETKRQRKEWRTNIIEALNLPTKDGKTTPLSEIKSLSKEDIENANLTQQEKITVVMIRESLKGNVKAAEWLAKMIGENGTEKHEINATIEEKPNKKKILQMMQKLDENPELEKELIGDDSDE